MERVPLSGVSIAAAAPSISLKKETILGKNEERLSTAAT
jgi:hypothetical protein